MKDKFKNKLCDSKMTFEECELTILRHAVDETEKKQNIEKVNNDGSMYLEENEWKNFTTSKEVIKIKGKRDSTIVIRSTGNGPVISDIHPLYKKSKHVVTFSWTGHWTVSYTHLTLPTIYSV